jgi:hypothetical protein
MTMLDKLNEIGRAPVGTRLRVTAPLRAWPEGGKQKNEYHRLEPPMMIQVIFTHDGTSFYGAADLGDSLRGYLIEFDWFHCLDRVE